MHWFKRRRIRKQLRRGRIPVTLWRERTKQISLFAGLARRERVRLRMLASLFLQSKTFVGAHGLAITDAMRITIASQACLLILKLPFDYYDDWSGIVIYPGAFRVRHDHLDEYGIVHSEQHTLSGESWEQGPLILSWSDILQDLRDSQSGHNVIIHEFAHKLDMLDGAANGIPELHAPMVREEWTRIMSRAFHSLEQQLARGQPPQIDPYAATDPAEFFAVVSENFFTAPRALQRKSPEVYGQLVQFYRQDPALRLDIA